jgi:hypothetical protein
MKTLQTNINEALFSKDGTDPQKISDKIRQEEIQKACTIRGKAELRVENGELYIKCLASQFDTIDIDIYQKNDLFPLNIRKIEGNCHGFYLTIRECNITSLKDVFSKDFENKLQANKTEGICLSLFRCNNLKSYEGCPQKVGGFFSQHCHAPLKDIPQYIERRLYILDTKIFQSNALNALNIDVRSCIGEDQIYNMVNKRDRETFQALLDIYHHLDPKCGVAKYIRKAIEDCNIDPNKKTVTF